MANFKGFSYENNFHHIHEAVPKLIWKKKKKKKKIELIVSNLKETKRFTLQNEFR